jgi:hypothetical protein
VVLIINLIIISIILIFIFVKLTYRFYVWGYKECLYNQGSTETHINEVMLWRFKKNIPGRIRLK